MSNATTNGYSLTPKFWLWLAEQAKTAEEKQMCLERALKAATEQEEL